MSTSYGNHIVVPDPQAKPGEPLNYMEWIGKYIDR